jgi:hypothetical protein
MAIETVLNETGRGGDQVKFSCIRTTLWLLYCRTARHREVAFKRQKTARFMNFFHDQKVCKMQIIKPSSPMVWSIISMHEIYTVAENGNIHLTMLVFTEG